MASLTIVKQWQSNNHQLVIVHCRFDDQAWYCGYVSVPECHDIDIYELDVHGGVTFEGTGDHFGYPDTEFIGFDTGHYKDTTTLYDIDYVTAQCESLLAQIKEQL